MSSIFVLIITAILLGPLVGALAAFRLFFPKNTLRIKEVFLFPIAFFLVILSNSYQLYLIFDSLPANITSTSLVFTWAFDHLRLQYFEGFFCLLCFLGTFFIPPIIVSVLISYFLLLSWDNYRNEAPPETPLGKAWVIIKKWTLIAKIQSIAANIVKNHVLNHIGQITSFDRDKEIQMLDVLTEEGFVYSGIYSDYALEDGKISNLSMKNIIRFRQHYDDKGNKTTTERYLLPNQGEIFFPYDKIRNFHLWKITKATRYTLDLEPEDPSKAKTDEERRKAESKCEGVLTYTTWLMTVQWVSKVKFSIEIFLPKKPAPIETNLKTLERMNIPPKQVLVKFLPQKKGP